MKTYESDVEAVENIDTCKGSLRSEFRSNKNDPEAFEEMWESR